MQTSIFPIWEEKGIIIGLFSHIIKNHHILKKYTIIINNDLYGSIIKLFFKQLKFKKHINLTQKNPYFINIKNLTVNLPHPTLYINNINNFQVINNDKITLLPWYDKDNPIIMFIYDLQLSGNIQEITEDITYFEKHIRFNKYDSPGKTKTNCVIDCWDTYYEQKILNKFINLYPNYTANQVNEIINYILLYPNCKPTQQYIPYIQQTAPQYIPVTHIKEVPKYIKTECKPEIQIREVPKYINTECKPIEELIGDIKPKTTKEKKIKEQLKAPISSSKNDGIDEFLKLVSKKIKTVNKTLQQDINDIPY